MKAGNCWAKKIAASLHLKQMESLPHLSRCSAAAIFLIVRSTMSHQCRSARVAAFTRMSAMPCLHLQQQRGMNTFNGMHASLDLQQQC